MATCTAVAYLHREDLEEKERVEILTEGAWEPAGPSRCIDKAVTNSRVG